MRRDAFSNRSGGTEARPTLEYILSNSACRSCQLLQGLGLTDAPISSNGLLFIGTEETPRLSFMDSPLVMRQLRVEVEKFRSKSIPGADHFYTNELDYVWRMVS